MKIFLLIVILFVTATTTTSDPVIVKSKQKYTYSKLKSIDCGTFTLDESSEDENIDINLVVNLTSCLHERHPANNAKLSYSTHLTSKAEQIFNRYFRLDSNTGQISLAKSIDREYICLNHQTQDDSIECDCRSDKCELKFKFNAFREISRKTQHYHLILKIKLIDQNDNMPIFKQNYLYLNISEFIGVNTLVNSESKMKSTICPYSSRLKRESKNINDDFLLSNTLIPLETNAIDLDSDKYSNIRYDLVLLKSKSCTLVSEMKDNFDLVKTELYDSTDCNSEFELVEANLNENYMQVQNMLFLKVNKYLDREVQDCFNFILIANDKQQVNDSLMESLKENNFMLIKLTIIDLNDNVPRFEEGKYVFDLNETTDLVFVDANQESYYFSLLQQTCSNLRLKVKAVDLDLNSNGLINYKIIQQVHRKNVNHKININKIFQSDVDISESLDPDSLFTINKQTGHIYLKICENLSKFNRQTLNRIKYLEITMLLDFELYVKHILVVEASDSSVYNPLQSFVTVEINIHDLNDHAPLLVSLFNTQCSVNSNENNRLDISIQNYKLSASSALNDRVYAAKLIIDGVSEWSTKSSCLGQFLITDLDTPRTNGRLEAVLVDFNDHTRISNEFVIRNVKDTFDNDLSSVASQHEIFELFLNFEPDAEQQRDYKYTLCLSDNGVLIRLKSFIEVIVFIRDENDNEPRFEQQSYLFKIDEWYHNPDVDYEDPASSASSSITLPNELVTNYCFGHVEAFDLDKSNVTSSITYELIYLDQTYPYMFYYNTTNGFICVQNRTMLDRETKGRYTFILYAINNLASNKLNSSVQIDVYLNDLNDNRPQFPVRDYSFFVAETDNNLINTLLISSDSTNKKGNNNKKLKYYKQDYMNYIGQIQASDKDIYLNADLKYYLKQNDNNLLEMNVNNLDETIDENQLVDHHSASKTKFKHIKNIDELLFINSTNGKLYLLKGIDREQITHIRFNVYVTDRRSAKTNAWPNEPLTNSVPVVIEFIDINDSKPTCTNLDPYPILQQNYQNYIFSIYFNLDQFKQYEPYLIYNLDCTDSDMAKNSELTFELTDINLKEIDNENSNGNNKVNNELANTSQLVNGLFEVNSKQGVLYFNFNQEWLANYNDTSLVINPIYLNIFNNNFFVLKFKISDNGMIPSFSYYTLKLRFCFNLSLKYCETSNTQSSESNQTSYTLKFVLQRLTNVDEEFFNLNEDNNFIDTNTQDEFSSKESDNEFDDVNFLNDEERLMNDLLINNKTALKNSHPYPNSYASSSSKLAFSFSFSYLLLLLFLLSVRWLNL